MANETKVLVIDDELDICKNVEKILKKNNYSVTHSQSAREALEMMRQDSFSLLISDIKMPEMNGLQLLKNVTKDFPLTKTIMMTGYASTDTAMKAIRLGALDYIPKPFTPNELRTIVDKALAGELTEMEISDQERESIDVMDFEIDFGQDEVVTLDRKEAPEKSEEPAPAPESYCSMGDMVCDIFEKVGATCKAGVKKNVCPRLEAKRKKQAKKAKTFDAKKLIGIDQPFDYDEVVSITGPEYVRYLDRDGFSYLPYEEWKKQPLKADAVSEKEKAGEAFTREVLVVDDEIAVNNNIRKILSKSGLEVDQAVTKAEALEKIAADRYKLVLLDLKIPGVAGLELLKAISEKQPGAKVVIITGYASIDTAVEAARTGAVDYLPKPFTPDEIRSVTERAFALAA
ncbi:MAG: response regulator [Desulfobacteraceae bacterium]